MGKFSTEGATWYQRIFKLFSYSNFDEADEKYPEESHSLSSVSVTDNSTEPETTAAPTTELPRPTPTDKDESGMTDADRSKI